MSDFELLLTADAVCTDKHPSDPAAKVVACGSAEAGYQVVGKGAPISAADAERYGVKTTKADANYTLRLDSHTIAITPEDKAHAATQPQFGLQIAQAEHIRTAGELALASLTTANAATAAATADDAKKADAKTNKKLAAKTKPAKKATRKSTKKAKTAAPTETAPANP